MEPSPFAVGKHLTVLFPCDRENCLLDVVVVEIKKEAYGAVSRTRAVPPCAPSASYPDSSAKKGSNGKIEKEINFARVAAVSRVLSTNVTAIFHIKNLYLPLGLSNFTWVGTRNRESRPGLVINHASRRRMQFALASSNAFIPAAPNG